MSTCVNRSRNRSRSNISNNIRNNFRINVENNKCEAGVVLLELIIFAFVLVVFAAGAARVHAAFGRRFAAVVRARNETIRAARDISDGGAAGGPAP